MIRGGAFGRWKGCFDRRRGLDVFCVFYIFRSFSEELFEFLTRFEVWNALGRNINRVAGFGIAAASRAALARAKTTESAQLDFLALVQRADYRIENCFDYYLSIALV